MVTVTPTIAARRLARWAPVLLVLYALGQLLLATAAVDSEALAITLSLACWLGFTALLLWLTAALVATELPRWGVVASLVVGTGLWYGLAYGWGEKAPEWAGILASCAMIVSMASFGRVLSWLFRDPRLLAPAMLVAGLVDIWGVNLGPVSQVAEAHPETVARASATLPGVASSRPGGFALADLSIGPGDIAVAALILGVVCAHGLDLRRNLRWMYGLTLAGLGLVLATGWLIPGLVFLGLAGLVANWHLFRYTRREWRDIAVALAFAAILLIIGAFAWHHAAPGIVDDGSNAAAEVRLQGD